MKHFVLTRHQCVMPNAPELTPRVMRYRDGLFQKFCVPSVAQQTSKNFTWMICHGPNYNPPKLDVGVEVVWVNGGVRSFVDEIRKRVEVGHVITTRFDSDDALAMNFVARVQEEFVATAEPYAINFCNGRRYDIRRDAYTQFNGASNPWISLVERADAVKTVYQYNHSHIVQSVRTVNLPDPDMWTQVLHTYNMSAYRKMKFQHENAVMDRYATHLPHLVRAALKTSGPMLELGCGYYSTPVLRAIAGVQGRECDVFAMEKSWATKFNAQQVESWDGWSPAKQYGLCLLDNELSGPKRFAMLPMLSKFCQCVVQHDAVALESKGVSWDTAKKWFARIEIHRDSANGTATLWRDAA